MRNKVIFLTGIPCSGKSTIAEVVSKYLSNSVILDGDDVRKSPISKDLGFSKEDRDKNIKRIGYISKLLYDKGISVICSFVSPIRKTRDEIRKLIGEDFIEVFVNCSQVECIKRDVKGMWARAKSGELKGFTGYDALYEEPLIPEVICETDKETLDESVGKIMSYINKVTARAFYIGRWQPFHEGHKYIIEQSLNKGIPVLIGIRDTLPDPKNPLTSLERKRIIEEYYRSKQLSDMVDVIIIPNIRSVNIGRKVGYEIIVVDAPKDIKEISGTKERDKNNIKVKYDKL